MRRFAIYAVMSFVLIGTCRAEGAPEETAPSAVSSPQVQLGSVFCLKTIWYPQNTVEEGEIENRIVRELVRQGVLIAVRDELGMVSRDETLGEPFPEMTDEKDAQHNNVSNPFDLWLKLSDEGTWKAKLFGAGFPFDNPVWQHEGQVEINSRTIYAELAPQVASLTQEIAEKLRAAGANGEARQLNPENKPDAVIEKRLAEMNFVSQYAAVRAAHQAIAQDGASLDWLGVLVRGYAHLALLTDHTWASHSEAFAARALLYAERMMQFGEASSLARWHRAYALAVIGAHGAAIDELAELEKSDDQDRPAWTKLVEPYVNFEHEDLDAVAVDHSELAETVAFLQWNLYHSYQHGRWIYEKGLDAMQEIPEAYGVYSVMANWKGLRIQRLGSYSGASAFGGLLPKRVATLHDLPESVKPLTAQGGFLSRLLGGEPDSTLSDRPVKIAQALHKATIEDATPGECSWAILEQLIREEQFIQAADMLKVSGNAVEYSKADVVERLLPLVEGHPYVPYIESFKYSRGEEEQRREALGDLLIFDPKGNMQPMFHRIWRVPTSDGRKGGYYSWRAVWGRNFTLPGMIESYYGSVISWPRSFKTQHREQFAGDFREISPHSPNAQRVPMETGAEFSREQLAQWESQLQDDSIGWMVLGQLYEKRDDLDGAVRCYDRSLQISPSKEVTFNLANMYYRTGKKDLWQRTLEAYLEVEDLGLVHAQIHHQIAWENMFKRDWAQAEPHALEAAQTYSNWGLVIASRIYEGMQQWDKSEQYIAAASQNYPSSSGAEWYFWCRRTGRGDIDAAREIAQKHIELASKQTSSSAMQRAFVYRVLEGQTESALEGLDQQLTTRTGSESVWSTVRRLFYDILACGDIKNEERKAEALAQARTVIEKRFDKNRSDWIELLAGLCDIFEGKEPSEEYLAKFDAVLAGSNEDLRCNYWYYLGAALDQMGKTELADKYLKKSAFSPGASFSYNVTLAGHRLVQKYGPERGGLPEEFAKIEAAIAAQAKADAEKAEKEEAEVGEEDASI